MSTADWSPDRIAPPGASLNDLVIAFDDAWHQHSAHAINSIKEILEKVSGGSRADLFAALLEVELHYRRNNGEVPDFKQYTDSFPEHAAVVGDVFYQEWPKLPSRFQVRKVLGTGGMGCVLQVHEHPPGRDVAIKVIKPELRADNNIRDRFLREVQAVAALQHENIVHINHVGTEDDCDAYFVMPLLAGETLKDRLERSHSFSIAEILRVSYEIAMGLGAAHDNSLVHRDIKPGNIWLEKTYNDRVKILDFGLVRHVNREASDLTQPGTQLGTAGYMAPEQALGGPVDHRADLFSLGCVIYHMATGKKPHGSSCQAASPAESLRPDLPSGLSILIAQLMEFDLGRRRPQSASQICERLRSIAATLGIRLPAGEDSPVVLAFGKRVSSQPLDLLTPGPEKQEIIRSYEPLIGKDRAERLWGLSESAIAAVALGDFERQVAIGKALEDIAPDNAFLQAEGAYFAAEGRRLLADVERGNETALKLRNSAIEDYYRALGALPADPRAVRGIGRTLEIQGKYDEALRQFKIAKGLCLTSSAGDVESRADLAHEVLRTNRHLIHCLLDIRTTSPQSPWRSENKRVELEGLLVACENDHREYMPTFRKAESWWRIEWFMGLVFLGKGWAQVGQKEKARQCLSYALDQRRRLICSEGVLSNVERANLKWWLAVATTGRMTGFDVQSYDLMERLAGEVDGGVRHRVLQAINDLIMPMLPPWDR